MTCTSAHNLWELGNFLVILLQNTREGVGRSFSETVEEKKKNLLNIKPLCYYFLSLPRLAPQHASLSKPPGRLSGVKQSTGRKYWASLQSLLGLLYGQLNWDE